VEGSASTIKLSLNSVRRARNDASLGYVPPSALTRGLSIRSVDTDGGNVFAVRVRVLHICPPMVKVFLPPPGGSALGKKPPQHGGRVSFGGLEGASGGSASLRLDAGEASMLRQMVAARRGKVQDSLEGDDELSLAAVLDYMGCDEWLVKTFEVRPAATSASATTFTATTASSLL
jgi:hypothetical protein